MKFGRWKWSPLGLFACIVFAAQLASASALFAPALSYDSHGEDNSESNYLTADFKLGKVWDRGFYLGVLYHWQKDSIGSTQISTWAVGPTVGLVFEEFRAFFTYHVLSSRDYQGTEYQDGSGPQFDVAYALKVSSKFKLGPQVTWRKLNYKTEVIRSTESKVDKTFSSVRPYIAFFFEF